MKTPIITCGMAWALALALQSAEPVPDEPQDKPQWLARTEEVIVEALKHHVSEAKVGSTNLSNLEAACRKAFREWPTPTGISRSGWKDEGLKLRLLVLEAAADERDKVYDLVSSAQAFRPVMPRVTNEQFDVYPRMDPEEVRDPKVRREYEEAIAEDKKLHAKWEREQKLEDLLSFGIFRTVTYIRVAYSEVKSPKRGMEVLRQFLDDEYLLGRFQRELDRRVW